MKKQSYDKIKTDDDIDFDILEEEEEEDDEDEDEGNGIIEYDFDSNDDTNLIPIVDKIIPVINTIGTIGNLISNNSEQITPKKLLPVNNKNILINNIIANSSEILNYDNNKVITFTNKIENEPCHIEDSQKYQEMFQHKIKDNFEKVFFKSFHGDNAKNSNQQSPLKNSTNQSPYKSTTSQRKTAFTKVSEDAYNKMIKNKSKVSCYDEMISDNYLIRMKEKITPESYQKVNSFLERTKEYNNKKSFLLLNQITPKIDISNNSKRSVRSPERFANDQIRLLERKNENLNQIRNEKLIMTKKEITDKPFISNKSRSLAKKKENNKEVHIRLFEENKKNKIKNEIKNVNENISENRLGNKKMNEKEISGLVNKLHKEGIDKKKEYQKMEGLIKVDVTPNAYDSPIAFKNFIENNNPKKVLNLDKNLRSHSATEKNNSNKKLIGVEDLDKTAKGSKLINLNKFYKEFEFAVVNINRHKKHFDFYEYCELLYYLGLAIYEHKKECGIILEDVEYNLNHKNTLSDLIEKELLLLKDSWRVLTKKKNIEFIEQVDVDQILIFILSILGMYKGEDINNENLNDLKLIDQLKLNNKTETRNLNIPLNSINEMSKSQTESQSNNLNIKTPINTINIPKDNFHDFLREAIPKLDINKYNYNTKIVFQLKTFFKEFFNNRNDFINTIRDQKRKEKSQKYKIPLVFKPEINSSSTKQSDNFKEKIVNMAILIEEKKGNDIKMLKKEDAYKILHQKKENGLIIQRQKKKEDEMKECTFSPKIKKIKITNNNFSERSKSTSTKDIGKRLYSHAMNKLLRIESIYQEKKSDLYQKDKQCTFSPKIIKLKKEIFENDLIHSDSLVKQELSRYEKARIEKRVKEYIKTKGLNSINKIKNMDEIISGKKEENLPQFKFENEVLQSKEYFDKYQKFSSGASGGITKSSTSRNSFIKNNITFNINSNMIKSFISIPLLNFYININENRKEIFCFYAEDDPIIATEKFCLKHNLKPEMKKIIIEMIEEKLSEL